MSFTNHTQNYNLPQYVGTDKPTFLGDFNNAMTAIDTALHNNAQNAGEGLSELQQAQTALTETQETLSEVQTEVANVSGIAATVNQNVQQALSAANDATSAANSATSQIQPAVTAANQASADAQAAQQVANGNVSTLTSLSERVTTLENSAVTEVDYTLSFSNLTNTTSGAGCNSSYTAPENKKITKVTATGNSGASWSVNYVGATGKNHSGGAGSISVNDTFEEETVTSVTFGSSNGSSLSSPDNTTFTIHIELGNRTA